jgi:hypothetical protein
MAAQGFRVIALVACVAAGAGGCQTLNPVPGHAVAQSDRAQDRAADASGYDPWLYQRLAGQDKNAPAASANDSSRPPGDVQQASATQAAPSVPGETVITAATYAKASKPEPKKKDDDDDPGFGLEALAPANVAK